MILGARERLDEVVAVTQRIGLKSLVEPDSFPEKTHITRWLSDFSEHLGEPFLDRFNSLCKEVE